ncbi:MAG: ubiquinone-binding protein [Candidatus Muproteobacteria bacterium RBG_16_64_11]|uniref:Ubiquinone-binding protein n=1 Tax=Candidatus Muproteobacteria bacterium RBG_16_64_11 TaxID=1817758 RepID=A0A1F6TII3_9PROT|nr:MAG: ubiquinone-binding protein [Candidatus Muproteobacteria bacterium RBG_16_64_11]
MSTIRKSALVPYSAHEMFVLVADVESYSQFLPWCGGSRILSRDEDSVAAAIEIAYSGVHKTFTTINRMQTDKMIEMRLVEGPFKHLFGYWSFLALDERASKVSLDMEFEFSSAMVGLVMGPVFSRIANDLVDSFRRRAEQLYGKR